MCVYAVKCGRTTGKFSTWTECFKSVHCFTGAEYKKFNTEEDADTYLGIGVGKPAIGAGIARLGSEFRNAFLSADSNKQTVGQSVRDNNNSCDNDTAVAYTDGSYNKLGAYGYGYVIKTPSGVYRFSGAGNKPELVSMRNVGGEIFACFTAVLKAKSIGVKHLTIVHDYTGLYEWVDGNWTPANPYSILYRNFINEVRKSMEIKFEWVKGHSGNTLNGEADKLSRQALSRGIVSDNDDVLKEISDICNANIRKSSSLVEC